MGGWRQKKGVGPMPERCEVCHGELRDGRAEFIFRHNGELVVVQNVPALVCEDCGEETFEPDVVERLQQAVWQKRCPVRLMQARVYDYAASDAAALAGVP